jgi:hypothetical protein
VKIGIRIESFAIIKYVVYPQPITYIVYCHAKLQLKVILGLLWVVVGSLWVVVGHCGSLWGRCGSLWIVVGSLWIVVGRCVSFHVLVTMLNYYAQKQWIIQLTSSLSK